MRPRSLSQIQVTTQKIAGARWDGFLIFCRCFLLPLGKELSCKNLEPVVEPLWRMFPSLVCRFFSGSEFCCWWRGNSCRCCLVYLDWNIYLQSLYIKVSNLLHLAMRLAMIGFTCGPVRLEAFLLKSSSFTETSYNMIQHEVKKSKHILKFFEVSNWPKACSWVWMVSLTMPQQSKIVFAGVEAAAFEISFQAIFQNFPLGYIWLGEKIHGESKISKRWKAFWKLGTWQFLEVYYILLPHRRLAVASSSLRIRPSEHVPLSRTKDAQLRMLEDAPNSTAQFGDLYRFV